MAVGGVIEGVPPGIELDFESIQKELDRRKPGQSAIVTQRKESDTVVFQSGIFEGKTTGTPIGFYIDLGAVVYEFKHCEGIFARRKLTMEAVQSMHADFYDLPDHTRDATYADSSSKGKILEEEVTINDCEPSLQTI